MQRDRDGRWDKRFKQLFHLFCSSLIQRRKVSARDFGIGDNDDLADVVHVRMSLHFHDAHYVFAALGRKRNRHSPGQLLEIFPIIYLWLINNEAAPIAVLFARPAGVCRPRRRVGVLCSKIARQKRTSCENDQGCDFHKIVRGGAKTAVVVVWASLDWAR